MAVQVLLLRDLVEERASFQGTIMHSRIYEVGKAEDKILTNLGSIIAAGPTGVPRGACASDIYFDRNLTSPAGQYLMSWTP